MKNPAILKLAEAKLASSGISLEEAKNLGIRPLDPSETGSLGFTALPALRLDYYGADGKPLSHWPGHPPFYRLRYLAQPANFAQLAGAKPLRYVQPPNTSCVAYFAKGHDWTCLQDPEKPILITEGELKSACACRRGFDTIGIGGVHNWRSLPKGVEFLPELEAVKWVGRHTYIVFDSDYTTNPLVCSALRDFADELIKRGAYVYVVTLPDIVTNGKTGLDDFLVAEGAPALTRLLTAAQPLGLTRPLFELNEKYVYVRSPGLILCQADQEKVSPAAFKEHLEATRTYQERILKPNGEISHRPVAASAAWLSWPLRREAKKLTYSPGNPRFLKDGSYNSWRGWGLDPARGNVKPFLDLLDHLFTGAEPEALDWFIKWLAWPLQHPGAKLFSSAVLHGVRHGTGKSLVGYTLGRIYGENFAEISQADLHGSFNEWAEGKQFVLGDDVTGTNKRADADMLKKLITQREMRVNIKYVPSYTVPDCVNYLFTSNHPDAFFLEDDDRRFFIHEVIVGPLGEQFYSNYAGYGADKGWLDVGGAQAVFDYLLRLDLKGFNPAAPALRTKAKARMISDVQSDLGGWVRMLLLAPDTILRVGEQELPQDMFTAKELLTLYDPTGSTGTTANGLGRELRRAGIQQVMSGQPIKLPDGTQNRYYVIRNTNRWLPAAKLNEVVKHLSDHKEVRKKF